MTTQRLHASAIRSLRALGSLAAGGLVAFLLTSAGSQGAASSSYADEVATDSPASYWRLDETGGAVAADARGRRPADVVGVPGRIVPGEVGIGNGAAVRFDGVDDHLSIPAKPGLGTGRGVTVELWFRRSRGGTTQVLAAGRDANKRGFVVWLDTRDRVRARFAGGGRAVDLIARTPVDTSWHHVVAISGGGTSRLFVDGSRQDRVRVAPRLGVPNRMRVGAGATGASPFAGAIDEVAIYRGTLSAARVQAHHEAGRKTAPPPTTTTVTTTTTTTTTTPTTTQPLPDTTAPVVTITAPAANATVTTTTPTIRGQAGTVVGDSTSVTVAVRTGTQTTGTPLRTLTATRAANGAYAVTVGPALAAGTYTAVATQSDAAGNIGTSSPRTFTIAPPADDPVLIGAGDISSCGTSPKDAETAALIAQHPSAVVVTLGDHAYDAGTAAQFACYNETWGAHKSRTRPTVGGDHDQGGTNNNFPGYRSYFSNQLTPFGPTATDPTKLYYSYNLGDWHVVHLNAGCFYYTPGCSVSGQESWFAADLDANPRLCTAVMLHMPRWSSGAVHGNNADMQNLWAIAHGRGVELVLSGDDHLYERFAPMDAGGGLDTAAGVRQMIVGTGGYSLYPFGAVKQNSQVRYNANFGVLKLTLHAASYDWQFLAIDGSSPDAGTTSCH